MNSNDTSGRSGDSTYHVLLITAALALMVMPFFTTFNEFLTSSEVSNTVARWLNLAPFLNDWVVPGIVRMVAVLMRPLGIQATVSQDSLYLTGADKFALVYISWNCIGWQSFVLFLVTLITGLRGQYTWVSKIHCLALGAVGTFMMNLVRIVIVSVVAFYFGRMPAILFHDYVGTLLIVVWLLVFWFSAYTAILERPAFSDSGFDVARRPKPSLVVRIGQIASAVPNWRYRGAR
ncbi:MAG: exosortase/archaeosortase family protein [Chloroflexi bacterium]|nr:exosortase/archaeosortase family protein [Chloroflexota bacterium]